MKSRIKTLILSLVSMFMFAIPGIAGTKACNIEPPNSPVEINVIGWSFEIMDFYADQMKKCGDVKNIDVNVHLQDFHNHPGFHKPPLSQFVRHSLCCFCFFY